jgi:hypothetical protein
VTVKLTPDFAASLPISITGGTAEVDYKASDAVEIFGKGSINSKETRGRRA